MILAPLFAASVIGCTSAFGPPSGWPHASQTNVVAGPLWFTGLRTYAQALPSAQPDGWYFAKTPTALRTGHTAVVRIDVRDRGWARLEYGRLDKVGAVTFSSCPRAGGVWTGWAGGFIVKRPGCVHFSVSVDGAPARKLKVALGQACT
jgi:hypothetical protein